MRKILYLSAVVLCVSCTKGINDSLMTEPVQEGGASIAVTKSGVAENISPKSYDVGIAAARSAAEGILSSGQKLLDFYPFSSEGDTLFYVANYEKGYKVISADSRTSAILLESGEGRLSLDDIVEDGKFNAPVFWLDNLCSEIYGLKKGYTASYDNSNVEFWNSVSMDVAPLLDSIDVDDPYHAWVMEQEYVTYRTYDQDNVDHLIQTEWGQGAPWNTRVPVDATGEHANCPAGCTAVALGQLLYFTNHNLSKPLWLNHDVAITGYSYGENNYSFTYSQGTYTSPSSRWDEMALDSLWTAPYTDYVASLLADIGHVLGIIYAPDGSGATLSTADFSYYGLDCTYMDYDRSRVSTDLGNGKPVLVTAYAGERRFLGIHVSYYDGHAWLIDGKDTRVNETTRGYVWKRVADLDYEPTGLYIYTEDQARALESDLYSGKRFTETTRAYSYFFRMNWGWDGGYDDNLYGTAWTSPWVSGYNNYEFQYDKHIFCNIY